MKNAVTRIRPNDNVCVAVETIPAGHVFTIDGITVTAREEVGVGHKIALSDLKQGDGVIKYGVRIGGSRRNIHRDHGCMRII